MKSLNKTQFQKEFALDLNKKLSEKLRKELIGKDAGIVVDSFRDMLVKHATDDRGCSYGGFLKCVVMKTKPRNGRNPATGESIKIPSKIRGKIVLLKSMKEELAELGNSFFGKSSKKSKKEKESSNKKEKKIVKEKSKAIKNKKHHKKEK